MPIDTPLHFPFTMILLLNVLGWPCIQIGLAAVFLRLPDSLFSPSSALFYPRSFEINGRIYKRLLRVRKWKHLVPDGARWLGHTFQKRDASLAEIRSSQYRQQLVRESCRGEAAHLLMLLCTPFFFLWNPLWADGVMLLYGLLSNGPCIVIQRDLRARLTAADCERIP